MIASLALCISAWARKESNSSVKLSPVIDKKKDETQLNTFQITVKTKPFYFFKRHRLQQQKTRIDSVFRMIDYDDSRISLSMILNGS